MQSNEEDDKRSSAAIVRHFWLYKDSIEIRKVKIAKSLSIANSISASSNVFYVAITERIGKLDIVGVGSALITLFASAGLFVHIADVAHEEKTATEAYKQGMVDASKIYEEEIRIIKKNLETAEQIFETFYTTGCRIVWIKTFDLEILYTKILFRH